MSENRERGDDEYRLNIGPGPFPLSIHDDPLAPLKPPSKGAEEDATRTRTRQIVEALPSPEAIALVGLTIAAVVEASHSNLLLAWIALAYALYGLTTSVLKKKQDP